MACSMGLSVLTVLFLAMTREAYAIVVAFLLFVIKMALIWMSRAWKYPFAWVSRAKGILFFCIRFDCVCRILRFFRRRRICVQAQPDLQNLNLARPHGFQRGLVLLRGDACA